LETDLFKQYAVFTVLTADPSSNGASKWCD